MRDVGRLYRSRQRIVDAVLAGRGLVAVVVSSFEELEVTVFHINDKSEFVGFLEVAFVAEGLQVLDPIAATRIDRDNVMHVERYLVSSIARSNGSTDSASVGVPDEHLIPKLLGNSPKRRLKLARDWNSSEDYCSNGLGLKIQAAQARDRISPAYLLAKAPHKTSREA